MTITPPTLYKYEPPTMQALRNLKTQTIYFGSPTRFNDPYDCALTPRIKPPSPEQIAKFRERYRADKRMTHAKRREFAQLDNGQLAAMLVRSASTVAEANVEKFLKTKGVTCFSETNNNLLMWSHYANRGQGFCLEFDTKFAPFEKIRRVEYSSEFPEIDLTESLLENKYDEMLRLYCTKSEHWAYEREWRGIHKEADKAFTYETACLTGVYFGTEVSVDVLEIVCLVLQGQNSKVRFYRGRRNSSKFIVDFEEFTYKSHLVGKRTRVDT